DRTRQAARGDCAHACGSGDNGRSARRGRASDQGSGLIDSRMRAAKQRGAAERSKPAQKTKSDLSRITVNELTQAEAKAELKRLVAEIGAHDKRYYQEDAPTVSDAVYDALRRRNEAIEQRFPDLVHADSPSRRVGAAPAQKFAKVRHAVPMLSLGNAFSAEDVTEFVERIRKFLRLKEDEIVAFTAEPKIDGLSCSLRYERGVLVNGATRGD